MRIERLELIAFGPFTDLTLDFSAPGLQVVYGPNEAGKSSALRALTAWLFGIPERTRDDFLHPRPSLLVGGTLATAGRRHTFYRRKKRKNDIVDREGNPIDPDQVAAMLTGLDRELFLGLHGIDHDTLVRGGREILAHRGEIGQALFSAGAGLGALHGALAAMEEEKEALYKPRGQNQVLGKEIRRYRDLEKRIRSLACSPEEWQRQNDELTRLDRELATATQERARLQAELTRLERLLLSAPLMARLKRIKARQDELGPRLILPADFSTRREEAQRQARVQAQRLQLARQRLARINDQEEKLVLKQGLLDQASRIGELVQQLGAIRKARQDRPRLEGMRAVLRKEAAAIMKQIAPDCEPGSAEPLLPLLGSRQRLLSLVREHALLGQQQESCQARIEENQRQLVELGKELEKNPIPSDPDALVKVIRLVRGEGDLDSRINDLDRKIANQRDSLERKLTGAGRWQGSIPELAELVLPSLTEIRLASRHLEERQRLFEEADRAIEELEQERIRVRAQISLQNRDGAPPSEDELTVLRTRRDRGWHLLMRFLLEKEDVSGEANVLCGQTPLHEWVWQQIVVTDQVSDRLRFEAERVHALAALVAREGEIAALMERAASTREEYAEQLTRARAEWQALWTFLADPAGSPPVMEEWRQGMAELREQARQLAIWEQEFAELTAQRRGLRKALAAEVARAGGEVHDDSLLAPLLLVAEELSESLIRSRQHHEELLRDQGRVAAELDQLKTELDRHGRALEAWQRQWRELAVIPGRSRPLRPDEAQDILDQAEELRSRYRQAEEFAVRLRGMERDHDRFTVEVANVVAECGADLAGIDQEEALVELQKRLDQALKDQALQDRISQDRIEAETDLSEAKTLLDAARQELASLLALAGCAKEEDLALAEERCREQALLQEQSVQTGQDLDQALAGMDPAEAGQALSDLDVDALPARIKALQEQIRNELDPAIRHLAEQRGEAAANLARMDGSDTAARLAEEQAASLAVIRSGAARFVRLQLAVDLLRHEIEAYRQANQGPILALASDIFARLTLGSFAGLSTDMDNQGEPVLVGLRPDSRQPIEVAAMSTGSRDQLFFALRLASIRHRAEQDRAMFHIFDDVLINFDEARGDATLAELAELGQSCQLILFTHQARVAERAASLDHVTVHDLAGLPCPGQPEERKE